MARTVSIRKSLLFSMLFIILLLSGGIMATTHLGSRRTVETLSADLISQALGKTEERLHRFFDPPARELLLAKSWGDKGLLDVDKPGALRLLLEPLMKQNPQISALLVADERGHEFMLYHSGDRWFDRRIKRDEWKGRTHWFEWSDKNPEPVVSWKELSYDPRKRPWFKGAVRLRSEAEGASPSFKWNQLLHWTRPYTFFTTKEPGITASITFDNGRGLDQVVGFDILLSEISRFTSSLQVTENGGVMVLTDDGRVLGLPSNARFSDDESRRAALLKQPEELGWPLAEDAARVFRASFGSGGGPLRFMSGGEMWWGEMSPFTLPGGSTFWISVVVPESDLLGGLGETRRWIIIITLGVLAVAILFVMMLARRFSRPIEALVDQSNQISCGDLERGDSIASIYTEVHRLAEAHERMRSGLRELLKLEGDLQLARQIQQKTLPKELPELVDYEIEAWSEPADETGGDTYDVIEARGDSRDGKEERVNRVVLLLADATGHGIGPALSATELRSMLRMAVRMGGEVFDYVRHLNEQLCADLHAGRFITAWLGELDCERHELASFSAGQAPLLHFDATRGAFNVLEADTLPFGVVNNLNVMPARPVVMNAGDIFAVISDGIYEAAREDGEKFGVERTREVIFSRRYGTPRAIIAALQEAVDAFTEGAQAADDRTALIVKRRGSAQGAG